LLLITTTNASFSVYQLGGGPNEGPVNFLFNFKVDLDYMCLCPFSSAQGLFGVGWDSNGITSGIIFLDKLVEKHPDAIVTFSGRLNSTCGLQKRNLFFFEEQDEEEEETFGLFDDSRLATLDSFFPYSGLIQDSEGFVLIDFSVSKPEIEEK
jgi:hypothetical protein